MPDGMHSLDLPALDRRTRAEVAHERHGLGRHRLGVVAVDGVATETGTDGNCRCAYANQPRSPVQSTVQWVTHACPRYRPQPGWVKQRALDWSLVPVVMPLLDLIVGYDCNLGCDYCTITQAMRRRALPAAAAAEALAQGRTDGFETLSITGGEPTIFAHLLPLVRRAKALGYRDIKVQSNGLMWAQQANVDRAIAAGVTRFSVSIHSHQRDTYHRIVRRDGTYEAMVAGLSNLVRASVPLSADVIVMRQTADSLTEAVVWLDALGVRHADFWFVSLTDGNASNHDSMPRMTEAVPQMRAAFAKARDLNMQVRSLHVPRCLLAEDHTHAYDPASVGVRVVTPDATFDLSRSRLTGQVHVPACDGCVHEPVCPGVRQDYLDRYGDGEIAVRRGQPPTRSGVVKMPTV